MKNTEFCQKLLKFFENKSKAIVNLVVALASNTNSKSVTELANNPLYNYQYSSICDAIDNVFQCKKDADDDIVMSQRFEFDRKLRNLLNQSLPPKWNDKYRLVNTDVTSIYREHSPTLKDREFVYAANNVIAGNKPISIGRRLSVVGLSWRQEEISWNLPLSMLNVPLDMNSSQFAAKQVQMIVSDKELFDNDIFINALDSAYCNRNYVYPLSNVANLINIIRIAGNRKVFHTYKGIERTGKGAKNRYGVSFKLNDKQTHSQPDNRYEFETQFKNTRRCKVYMQQWNDMILRGKDKKKCMTKSLI